MWLAIFLFLFHASFGRNVDTFCESPQLLDLWKTGVIKANFTNDFFTVVWYNVTGVQTAEPLIKLKQNEKSGIGYDSGEYDIQSDGSLVIVNVTTEHDMKLKGVEFATQSDFPCSCEVTVITVVKPQYPYPIVDKCETNSEVCILESTPETKITCHVKHARPAVHLIWLYRYYTRDEIIAHGKEEISEESFVSLSTASIDNVFRDELISVYLVCRADSSHGIMERDETLILVQNSNIKMPSKPKNETYVELNSTTVLRCDIKNTSFLLWKKQHFENVFDIVCSSVLNQGNFRTNCSTNFILGSDGSLKISHTESEHEGIYICISSNHSREDISVYEVKTFANPVPNHIVVEGCNHDHYCVLDGNLEGVLTCSVTGIRPQVMLQWKLLPHTTPLSVKFINHSLLTVENEDTYDITLITFYSAKVTSDSNVTLECRVTDSPIHNLKMKIDLKFTLASSSKPFLFKTIIVVLTSAALLLVFIVGFLCCHFTGCRKKSHSGQRDPDLTELLHSKDPELAHFNKNLKMRYSDLFSAVQPLPHSREEFHCVNRIFINGGVEIRVKDNIWQSRNSYHDIFEKIVNTAQRYVIEGDPGYGKSILCLQLAYEWCERSQGSSFYEYDTFILLRLRQLEGIGSIYEAIKQCLLPKETQMTEDIIKGILQRASSVVFVLDGYDEYPDRAKAPSTDILRIIENTMFPNFDVIVTTRSSVLPPCISAKTRRARLTGFDHNARQKYIEQVLVGDDTKELNRIMNYVPNDSLLADVFQVPLLFVMFAHLKISENEFGIFKTVTSFIGCLHRHMMNKTRTENTTTCEFYQNEHANLDKVAYESLTSTNPKTVFRKDELVKRLGKEFLDQYIRIGILHQEGSNEFGAHGNEVQVAFYHNIFCEWYAAHFVESHMVAEENSELRHCLDKIRPSEHLYVYQFSCGLKPHYAGTILQYLWQKKNCRGYALLCLAELGDRVSNVSKVVQAMCKEDITIGRHERRLYQRSKTNLLQRACELEISISKVELADCFKAIDNSSKNLMLTSSVSFSPLKTLLKMRITERGRELSDTETVATLKFVAGCPQLQTVEFYYCMMPQNVQKKDLLDVLQKREVKVRWCPRESSMYCTWYEMDLTKGKWQYEEEGTKHELTKTYFVQLVKIYRDKFDYTEWQKDRKSNIVQTKGNSNDLKLVQAYNNNVQT